MISLIKQYSLAVWSILIAIAAASIYIVGYRKGADKWKAKAKQQEAKAKAIQRARADAKAAKEAATEYEHEQSEKSEKQINQSGHTDSLGDDINRWP